MYVALYFEYCIFIFAFIAFYFCFSLYIYSAFIFLSDLSILIGMVLIVKDASIKLEIKM